MGTTVKIMEALKAPFADCDVKFRIQAMTQSKDKALLLPYIDARAVADRLDSVLGIASWKDEYEEWQSVIPHSLDGNLINTAFAGDINQIRGFVEDVYQKGVKCRLSVKIENEWITKEDGAANTDIQGTKGGYSQALRRAAVKFGIGRYLYNLPDLWVPVSNNRQGNQESIHYKGGYYFYTKPSLAGMVALPTPAPTSTPTPEHKNTTAPAQGNSSGEMQNPPPGGPALDQATFNDYQSRLAKLAAGKKKALDYLSEAASQNNSMDRVKKLLGCCWELFAKEAPGKSTISEVVSSPNPNIGEMMIVLKNAVMTLESIK